MVFTSPSLFSITRERIRVSAIPALCNEYAGCRVVARRNEWRGARFGNAMRAFFRLIQWRITRVAMFQEQAGLPEQNLPCPHEPRRGESYAKSRFSADSVDARCWIYDRCWNFDESEAGRFRRNGDLQCLWQSRR